jgi:PPOX class probable F420-dependent enzyme
MESPRTLPARIDEFLSRANPSVMACVRPDGFPMTVATWYHWQDGRILVNMDAGRRRLVWIRQNPRVSLTVFDDDWYRHVSLYGSVISIHDDSDLRDIDRLARRYGGNAFRSRTAKRVSAWIQPHGWHGWDPSGELAGGGPLRGGG